MSTLETPEQHDNQKVNFVKLRTLYEEGKKQEQIDQFIKLALNHSLIEDRKDLFKGITVSPSLAECLNLSQLSELLLTGAEPKELLTQKVMNVKPEFYHFNTFNELYKGEFITIEFLEKVILEAKRVTETEISADIENICDFFEQEDLSIYAGLNIQCLVDTLLAFLEIHDKAKYDKKIFQALCNILRKAPFDKERNEKITNNILESIFIKTNSDELIFTLTLILRGKTPKEIIEMLYARPDLVSIFSSDDSIKRVLAIKTSTQDLRDLICEGNIGPIGLAFHLYNDLCVNSIMILNSWIAKGRVLPIDIYMEGILTGTIQSSYEELDKKHIEALQGEKDKPFVMNPIEGENN